MNEPTGGPPPSPPEPPSAPPPPPPPSDPPSAGSPPPPAGSPPPPPATSGGGNKGLMIVLSYLGLLALVPLLMEKEDQEVQWHAKHGLVLLAAEVVVWIVLTIFQMAIAAFDFGCTGCILSSAFFIAVIVVHILCIVKGVNGQRFIIPGISQFADKF